MWTLPLGPSVELPRGHEPCEGCAEMVGGRYADPATGAFGGAPYGATKRDDRDSDRDSDCDDADKDGEKRRRRKEGQREETRGAANSKRGPNTQEGWEKQYAEGCVRAIFRTDSGREEGGIHIE